MIWSTPSPAQQIRFPRISAFVLAAPERSTRFRPTRLRYSTAKPHFRSRNERTGESLRPPSAPAPTTLDPAAAPRARASVPSRPSAHPRPRRCRLSPSLPPRSSPTPPPRLPPRPTSPCPSTFRTRSTLRSPQRRCPRTPSTLCHRSSRYAGAAPPPFPFLLLGRRSGRPASTICVVGRR
jgi:hypothetical protein